MKSQEFKELEINIAANNRYQRLLKIEGHLYKILFNYSSPQYAWTNNEYNQMFKEINNLCKEYDGMDWLTSELTCGKVEKSVLMAAYAKWME